MSWLGGLARRRKARLAGAILGVGLTVTVLASLGAFFAASKAKMTAEAVRGVPIAWQVQLQGNADPLAATKVIAAAPGVTKTAIVGYASTTGLTATTGGTTQTTGPGKVLGLPANYATEFPGEIRFLIGAQSGVLLAQQTAANLHANVGTTIQVGRPGLKPVSVKVQGVVDLPAADSMFQAIGASAAAAPTAPPDNVVLLPETMWHRFFDPVAASSPSAVATQIHVGLSSTLPPDPSAAFAQVLARAKNLEAQLASAGFVGNNLGAQLDAGRSDSLYAELLFLFLGLPGAIIAALLTLVLGAAGADRRRREQALLRVRGASPRTLLLIASMEAALVGVVGCGLGLAGAGVAGRLAFGTARLGASGLQAFLWASVAVLAGLCLSFAAIVIPAWRDARLITVAQARSVLGETRRPFWQKLYLDLILLVAGGLIFWQAVRSGYQVVLAPEGVPTISVDYFTLVAPICFWTGSALLAWRISMFSLRRGRRVLAAVTAPLAGGLSGVVAASMMRQRRLLSRGLTIVALTASFAVSTAVFNATYQAQARVDAELTNGADVMATTTAAAGLPAAILQQTSTLPGVVAARPMQHRFAYVGNDLQDLYGIDPSTIGQVTPMSDAFFAGGSASQVLSTLASHPDGVLVSDETVRDFQLQPGDLIRLRLQFATDHAYHVVPFHYVGIVREFPTAPHDSFLVANASYVAKMTGSGAYQTLLVKTSGSPPAVASELRGLLGPATGATVQDIVSELKITLSGLTALDLSGLTRLELAFAFLLALAASGMMLALGLAERRRTFAITAALGAKTHQLASFVWSEAAFVTLGGTILGVAGGWWISYVLVKILTGVFDPPPGSLDVPWPYLLLLGAATLVAVATAGIGMVRATRRPAVELLRDL